MVMTIHQRLNFWSIPVILCLLTTAGCGAAGAPIPPEDVGIEAKVREQQEAREKALQKEEGIPIEEESVTLPALRPIGTR